MDDPIALKKKKKKFIVCVITVDFWKQVSCFSCKLPKMTIGLKIKTRIDWVANLWWIQSYDAFSWQTMLNICRTIANNVFFKHGNDQIKSKWFVKKNVRNILGLNDIWTILIMNFFADYSDVMNPHCILEWSLVYWDCIM